MALSKTYPLPNRYTVSVPRCSSPPFVRLDSFPFSGSKFDSYLTARENFDHVAGGLAHVPGVH
jgi:hypothetical protein